MAAKKRHERDPLRGETYDKARPTVEQDPWGREKLECEQIETHGPDLPRPSEERPHMVNTTLDSNLFVYSPGYINIIGYILCDSVKINNNKKKICHN